MQEGAASSIRMAMQNLVTVFGGSGFIGAQTVRQLAKAGWRIRVAVRNPAFDVTPAELVTALITEKGIVHAPDRARIAVLFT